MDIKTSELGQVFSDKELKQQFKEIYGGVSWQGERPGFAVVLGMDKRQHYDSHDIYLLDEYESFDMRQLVQQCGVLDFKYQPTVWIGDNRNNAADRLIREMNASFSRNRQEWSFSLSSTTMLKMEDLYHYILSKLKELLDEERRQLFLRDSKILNYLSTIEPSEISDLELGSYPAIEALAFATIEMRKRSKQPCMTLEEIHQLQFEVGLVDKIP